MPFVLFYAYNRNYRNAIEPFLSILNCWFHSCFLFALSFKYSIVLRAMRITAASISRLRKKGQIKCLLKTEQTSHQEGSQTKANVCWEIIFFLWLHWKSLFFCSFILGQSGNTAAAKVFRNKCIVVESVLKMVMSFGKWVLRKCYALNWMRFPLKFCFVNEA